ncbi:hypothetical protein XAC3810_100055 [Xanthomonas citri pv. citri]|uniref:Uncharacterized protein n=1 Tax=Xanthomonas citri pv. citri TaxID=611301 RepID=A0A0U4YRZ7_XANCI|nr:hypothetical protein XAC3824_120055 [Xanthomonas citri pv. citri]CEE17316.1 hypothetical protein XAC1083_110056 [Xanthomonas citri pv. citri]CEE21102.1 hypothetical protein XAC902_110055 [Xanthomonas citri pv. citri]CEE22250.1 hypothetical protein XAC3810_100055 [Xanthomonas citri pv. citri]CEE23330.1 hypothetical protein XAC2911_110056 [Xanthomonas citri pv. citri]
MSWDEQKPSRDRGLFVVCTSKGLSGSIGIRTGRATDGSTSPQRRRAADRCPMQSSGFMERFNDSEQRGVLDMHGFRGVSEAIKQTGRRLAGCRHPIKTAWARRANTRRALRSTSPACLPFKVPGAISPVSRA